MEDINLVTTDNWKGVLNFESTCTSAGPQNRCGLISELTPWNRVLFGVNYELAETSPGKLSLRYVPYSAAHERRENSAPEAAFLISWLVEKHHCIDELRVSGSVCPDDATWEQLSATIRLRPPAGKGIRCLHVEVCEPLPSESPSFCWLWENDTDALRNIEELTVRCCEANYETGLVKLLRNNSTTLRHVQVMQRQLSPHVVDALRHLDRCKSLEVSVCLNHFHHMEWDADTTSRLLRNLPRVRKLRLLSSTRSESPVSAIAHVLKTDSNLKSLELHMYGIRRSVGQLFAALEVNTSVKKLLIAVDRFDASCGQSLASALCKNASLQELILGGDATEGCMKSMAQALSRNTSLETLQFTYVSSVYGVLAVCDALRTNTTLKKVVFPTFRASQAHRAALAEKLAEGDGYSRVLLTHLTAPDLLKLPSLLTSSTSCPRALGRIDISNVTGDILKPFLDALASSSARVQSLGFILSENTKAKVNALCSALSVNRSLTGVTVQMKNDRGQCLRELLKAFEANRGINDVEIAINSLGAEAASALSDFFAANRTVTTFQLIITGRDYYWAVERCHEVMSRAMVRNPVIIQFQAGMHSGFEFPNYRISEALRRNWSTLNRAVDFVLLSNKDRRDAEAFEIFSERSCLLDQVMKTSGQSELDARQAIASAENFRRRNFFVITGVVRRAIVCHPVVGRTQCDELNADCWGLIVRYLKVSDVLG